MNAAGYPNRNFEWMAMVFSLGYHMLIGGLLTVTFALRPVAHKPAMVFLGSILSSQDLIVLSAPYPKSSAAPSAAPLPAHPPENVFYDGQTALTKPVLSPAAIRSDKSFEKTTFLETDLPEERAESQEDIGVSLKLPPYTPLRLFAK